MRGRALCVTLALMAYEELLAIFRRQAEARQEWLDAPPVACPIDGSPLDIGPNGELHCPMGNWTWTLSGSPTDKA